MMYARPGRCHGIRRRGGAVVLVGGRMLLIRYAPEDGHKYFIPGGGVEPGEAPSVTAERELAEETGLIATAERQLAMVRNSDRVEHYYLMRLADPHRAEQRAASGDLSPGQQLEWVDVALLPNTPVWPKRLAWRITAWSRNGWPDRPVELEDSIRDLHAPCHW
jgi:8-oxo-dGTP diphosphatase